MQKLSLKQKLNILLAIEGITFREFAKKIGLSHSGLYAIAKYSRMPSKKSVVKILIDITKDFDEKYKIRIEDFISNM